MSPAPAPNATLRASVTAAAAGSLVGASAPVLVDGSDTPITANGLQDYTPTPGDRLLVQQVGQRVEILQFLSRGTVPGAFVADGSITDAKIALNALNPAKGISDMRPGAFTSLIHDWPFSDPTLKASRIAGKTSMTFKTITEEMPAGTQLGGLPNTGSVPTQYAAGAHTSLLGLYTDTSNTQLNAIKVAITATLNPGDVVISHTHSIVGFVGSTQWAAMGEVALNEDPTTDGAPDHGGGFGVQGFWRMELLNVSNTVLYTTQGNNFADNFYSVTDTVAANPAAFPTTTQIRWSFIWNGPTTAVDTGGHWSFTCPGISVWQIGGAEFGVGTPYLELDHNGTSEDMTLLAGLPVSAFDTYTMSVHFNPYNQSSTAASPIGQGKMIMVLHDQVGGTSTATIGGGSTGTFENSGWRHATADVTFPANVSTIDIILRQTQTSDSTKTRIMFPRLTSSGFLLGKGTATTLRGGGLINDQSLKLLDPDGASTFQHTGNQGTLTTGILAVKPHTQGRVGIDLQSGIGMWPGGDDVVTGEPDSTPMKVGIALDPYFAFKDAPVDLLGMKNPNDLAPWKPPRVVLTADRGGTGTYAPKGFVGVVRGGDNTALGSTSHKTGFTFDSDANTVTLHGTASGFPSGGGGGRIVGEIVPYGGLTTPALWLACDGSAVSRSTYSALFAATSLTFTGNTHTTITIDGVSTTFTAQLKVGWFISGSGIPAGATIASVGSGTFTISVATTSTLTGTSIVVSPFGIGDGTTTFNTPNITDRGPVGASGTKAIGAAGGAASITLTTTELPAHTHAAGTLATNTTGSAHNHPIDIGNTTGTSTAVLAKATATITNAGATGPYDPSTAGTHTHGVTGSTASSGTGSAFSIMDPYLAVPFLIYAGV